MSTLAAALTIGAHLASAHAPGSAVAPNNLNLGVYAQAENGLIVGTYRNTLRRQSFYLGHTSSWGPVSLSIGAVTGYRLHVDGEGPCRSNPDRTCLTYGGMSKGPLALMFAPSIALPAVHGATPRLWLIPNPRGAVLHLSVEWK